MNRHTLAVVMINRADAVARISGLLAARNIRLESIIGGPTDDPDYFLFSIIVEADEAQALRTARQIAKLVDTIRVEVVPC
jgi:acetolactate synthase small subunit